MKIFVTYSLLPAPKSLLPIPYSLFPVPFPIKNPIYLVQCKSYEFGL
ncbi:MAG: hypothetical protein F6K56_24930 [Moorea sp. SIO3G5]|nr:hypothetical protein [Moorena sp. SIO3G5]